MNSNNSSNNQNINIVGIVIISAILGLLFTTANYFFMEWISYGNKFTKSDIIMMLSIIFGFLVMLISVLLGIMVSKNWKTSETKKELKSFKDFTDAINNSSTDIDVFEKLYSYLKNLFVKNKISIYYRDDRNTDDINWPRMSNERLPLCDMSHKFCPVISQEKECFVSDIKEDITCAYQLPEYTSGSYICFFIKAEDKINGVLQLYSKEKMFFDDDRVASIRSSIETINPMIERNRTLKKLEQEAHTDRLTKVANRAFFETKLEETVELSIKSNKPLSFIILDIDHFKKVNDNYGHPAGDCILVIFAQVILRCIRKTDILARYGGEEFVVILPETDTKVALTIAERIRETVENERMPVFQEKVLPKITCSLGLSICPEFAKDKSKLIKTADLALYRAKESGRNRVVIYEPNMGTDLDKIKK